MTQQLDSHPTTHLLHADPRAIDKILANELNSLSFDDREALTEEMHAVRSLATRETPEMIHNSLLELEKEINKRLRTALASLSSSSIHQKEYLGDLLVASELMASSVPSSSSSASIRLISVSSNSTTHLSKDSEKNNQNNMINENNNIVPTKYSYALSKGFLTKFLRAELFDVKKAASRYILCIDWLVGYFGTVSLERPLYLKDLDKQEQKMMKEGRLQLMPSRDRLGRRILVFLGAVGHGYSDWNRFKFTTYMIFQAASDDETTQRNGVVAIYSRHEDNARNILQLAYHQKETLRFMDAVPLRYAAFHLILPDGIHAMRGVLLNMVGKKTRLITQCHTVSSVMETLYKLRCFGIPTEDFPLTSSGSIKTKNLMKWIKFRTAQEKAHERGERIPCYQHQPPMLSLDIDNSNNNSCASSSSFLGIECPELDSVIFRNGGSAWDHPGNVQFRRILTEREPDRELHKTMAEKNSFLDGIITELFSSGLKFLVYDDKNDWYVELRDYGILRKKVFQALRDQSARRKRGEIGTQKDPRNDVSHRPSDRRTHQVNQSSTSLFLDLGNNNRNRNHTESTSVVGLNDVKRRKMSEGRKSGLLI